MKKPKEEPLPVKKTKEELDAERLNANLRADHERYLAYWLTLNPRDRALLPRPVLYRESA